MNEILEDEIVIARDVKRLKDSFLDQFFKDKEQQLFDHFKRIPIGAANDLVELHHQLKSMNALQVEIQSAMDTGKMAQIGLDASNE